MISLFLSGRLVINKNIGRAAFYCRTQQMTSFYCNSDHSHCIYTVFNDLCFNSSTIEDKSVAKYQVASYAFDLRYLYE